MDKEKFIKILLLYGRACDFEGMYKEDRTSHFHISMGREKSRKVYDGFANRRFERTKPQKKF